MSVPSILFGALPSLFFSQLFVTPKTPQTDCSGKTIIVTGGNTGLGKEAARHFVRLGAAKVILGCRSLSKGEEAKRDIEQSTRRTGVVEVWAIDLADYASVQAFARKAEGLERLDAVLENAGVNTQKFKLVDGIETNLQINVVSTFLLALLMIPKLRADGRKFNFTPTLVIVTSELHAFTAFKEHKEAHIFDTLNDEKKANMGGRYPISKLLEVFACRQIAKEHPVRQLGCIISLVNPGWCHSELARELITPVVKFVMNIMCRTTEVGSRTLVDATVSHGSEVHGQYLSDQKAKPVAPLVQGKGGAEIQMHVWQELAEKLEHIQPGILRNLDR
ncbi:hypothetical protein LTR66_004967 [Elasticomyces elasticus]|nr:hypothetical protein LTR66_004967 [Elasticomyces elasticus]